MYTFTSNIWAGLYNFVNDHSHDGHGDFTSCKTYSHQDRMNIVNKYLLDTSKYSMEVYQLYQYLKEAAKDI